MEEEKANFKLLFNLCMKAHAKAETQLDYLAAVVNIFLIKHVNKSMCVFDMNENHLCLGPTRRRSH